jgi:hypothetical protein
MTKNLINKAIKYLGLEIVGKRGDGYFYFCDLQKGHQVGESVLVCYLNQLTLAQWIKEAEHAELQYIKSL